MCPGKVGQPGAAATMDATKNEWCFGKESVEAAIAAVGRGELVSCRLPLPRPCAAPLTSLLHSTVRREKGSKMPRPHAAGPRADAWCARIVSWQNCVQLGHDGRRSWQLGFPLN